MVRRNGPSGAQICALNINKTDINDRKSRANILKDAYYETRAYLRKQDYENQIVLQCI